MKEYRTMDKTKWGPGPWQDEPDKVQWMDEQTGLPCLIVRAPSTGALCGYVGVAHGHPAYLADYDSVEADVHGGLTFAGPCQKGVPIESGVCHVPALGEVDDVWWLGFDCAHAFDVMPAMNALRATIWKDLPPLKEMRDVYRDIAYVKAEVAALAAQLKQSAQ